MHDIEEKKLEKLIAALRIADNDTISSDEVAQAVEIILGVIAALKDEKDADIGEATRGVKKLIDDVLRKARAWRKESLLGIAAVRKIATSLVKWKEAQEMLTTDEDLNEVIDQANRNEIAIEELRRNIDLFKAKYQKPKNGNDGKAPEHEWEGTAIRFKNPDGSWGEFVDLKGESGGGGGFLGWGSSMGVQRIRAGANITITGDPANPIITSTASGGGGGSQTIEDPSGAVNDSNTQFTFSAKPFVIVMNNGTYREDAVNGWTWDSGTLTATMPSVVGTGGEIYGIMQ